MSSLEKQTHAQLFEMADGRRVLCPVVPKSTFISAPPPSSMLLARHWSVGTARDPAPSTLLIGPSPVRSPPSLPIVFDLPSNVFFFSLSFVCRRILSFLIIWQIDPKVFNLCFVYTHMFL